LRRKCGVVNTAPDPKIEGSNPASLGKGREKLNKQPTQVPKLQFIRILGPVS
jgi:hypothetical protein